jgi:hypothetical protein
MVLGAATIASAQEQESQAAELAKAAQNPLAALVTLPLQANFNNGIGDDDRRMFNLNIQPVAPFKGEDWNLITRTIIPLNSMPRGVDEADFGLGDANTTLFLSPAKASAVTWGVGPVINFPSASNPERLGTGKWGLGPAGVIFIQTGRFTYGGLVNNVWSVAGDSDREDYNRFLLQWFVNFNFGGGWALGTVPIVTADWNADSGEQWTVPWGAQLSKVMRIGQQPVNLLAGYYYNATRPTGGPESQVRVQLNLMFPIKGD